MTAARYVVRVREGGGSWPLRDRRGHIRSYPTPAHARRALYALPAWLLVRAEIAPRG